MAGRSARVKGAAAEREFFGLINNLLGRVVFKRNLMQSRQGGADSDDDNDTNVCIEVKRQERLCLPAWLKQAREQAAKVGKMPVLAYRRSREDWTILVEMTPEQFAEYLRSEELNRRDDGTA